MAKKSKIKPMPINTREWLRPNMRALPPDVRGLWVDLLCYMWESPECGVMVAPDHRAYSKEDIIRIIGIDCKGGGDWLDILVAHDICQVREDGAYYCAQMVKAEDISAKRREAGSKGGRASLGKNREEGLQEERVTPIPVAVVEPPVVQAELFPIQPTSEPPPLTTRQKAVAERAKKYHYAQYVTLTRDEYATLCGEYGEDATKSMIEILNNYKGSRGRQYKSDYLAIRSWVIEKYYENMQKYGSIKNNGGAIEPPEQTGTSGYSDTL